MTTSVFRKTSASTVQEESWMTPVAPRAYIYIYIYIYTHTHTYI